MKYSLLLTILLLFTVKSFTQTVDSDELRQILTKLQTEKDNTKKADLFYKAALYYINKDDTSINEIDSASTFNNQSIAISKKLNLKENIAKCMLLSGEIAGKRGNTDEAILLKNKALSYSLKNGLKKEAANVYLSLAFELADNDRLKKTEYFNKAVSLYSQSGALYDEAQAFCELAIMYNNIDEPVISIKYAKQAIQIKKSIKRYDLYKEYAVLALNYRIQGNYEDALAYALDSEKIAENKNSDEVWLSVIYNLIGTIYSELKFEDKSTEYYKKAIELAKKMDDADAVTSITLNTARGLYSRNKYAEALNILNGGCKYFDINDCNVGYNSLYILIYCQLKKCNKATPYYQRLLKCDNNKNHIAQEIMYYAMIHYLLKTGQANKTYVYIAKLKKLAAVNNDLLNLSQLEKKHFEADSATGNYLSAIEHFKNHKILNDSLYNIKSAKQFGDLQLKYETEKKDKSIKLLTEHGKYQEEKIRNATILRYVFIGSLIILIIFIALIYNRSRLKQLANKKLELKQLQINEQNDQLKKLVIEKEWLLKEIHHRVKNNLQIVISLLNTQSAYLENKDALMAIQNSQHRMHAMSLIHQKLYQSDNLASIDMSWYIYELVNYLKESFDLDDKISYKLDTEHIELDVSEAVPLGLIINEAISNAIKYAFKDKSTGQISISFNKTQDNNYCLIIADNGIGLPEGFDMHERESLGMDLMMGLTNQLCGTFELKNDYGLTITIKFSKKQLKDADAVSLN